MLTKRLEYIVNRIPKCGVLADVGCDHGYVGTEALKRDVADRVLFVDISPACLQKARTNCPADLKTRAEFVCRDGLGDLECDAALICGMGGLEILSVLKGAARLPETVVLQPMRNVTDVRVFVAEHYEITLDVTVSDGKFYSIIAARNTGKHTPDMTELEREFGITNINNPSEDFAQYLLCEQTKLTSILSGCNVGEVSKRLALVNAGLEQIRRKL